MAKEVSREVAKSLRALSGAWKTAEPRSFTTTPDGDYLAKIIDMRVDLSKKNRLQVVTIFKVQDGLYKGSEVYRFDGIDSDVSMSWCKGYFDTLGIDAPENIEELPDVLADFVANDESVYNITLKTKDEFQNTMVKGVNDFTSDLEPSAEEVEPEAEATKSTNRHGRAAASRTAAKPGKTSRR